MVFLIVFGGVSGSGVELYLNKLGSRQQDQSVLDAI
jgi:hypothetical protein